MKARRESNIIAFRPSKAGGSALQRQPAKTVLRAVWRVAAETGRLECVWTDTVPTEIAYSRAA